MGDSDEPSDHDWKTALDGPVATEDLPSSVDPDSFTPIPADYSIADSFLRQVKSSLKGVFVSEVIEACFDGDPLPAEYNQDSCVNMVGAVGGCVFSLLLDVERSLVMSGYVLQCRPAVATQNMIWTDEAIQTMSEIAPKTIGNPWDGKAETWNGYFECKAVEEGRAYKSSDGTEYW